MTIFFPEAANKRVILAHVQPVNADLNDVFPLLCPVRRYEWDADWNCELVHTDSGVAEELCVFRVESGSNQGTWCVTRYQQGQSISLFRVNADFITEVNISAYANPNGGSTIHWEVTSTGHSDAGDAAITAATDEAFIAEVQQLTQQLEQRANGDALGYAPSRNDDGSFAPQSKYTRVNAKATAHASPPPEAIHPMFSPVREYEWEPKWLCKYHYNMTRDMEQSEIHWVDDPDFADYGIWMTVRYDRPHRLTHMRINDDRVTVYDWTYDRAANGGTDMGWNITDTGLNEAIIPHIRYHDRRALAEGLGKSSPPIRILYLHR